MDTDLKQDLLTKIDEVGQLKPYRLHPDVMLYESFKHHYGFTSSPLDASDAVEALDALIQAAEGVRVEVRAAGGHGGGEWFSGQHQWDICKIKEASGLQAPSKTSASHNDASHLATDTRNEASNVDPLEKEAVDRQKQIQGDREIEVANFWHAFDALHPQSASSICQLFTLNR